MKPLRRKGALFLLILITGVSWGIAMQSTLVPEAQKAADTWLSRDCGVGETDELRAVLLQYKEQLQPFFLNALTNGPARDGLLQFEKSASARFDLRQEALKRGNGLGVSTDALDAARRMTRQGYIDADKKSFVTSYQSRAITALAIVGGASGKAALAALAADENSPLQRSAKQALMQLQPAQK